MLDTILYLLFLHILSHNVFHYTNRHSVVTRCTLSLSHLRLSTPLQHNNPSFHEKPLCFLAHGNHSQFTPPPRNLPTYQIRTIARTLLFTPFCFSYIAHSTKPLSTHHHSQHLDPTSRIHNNLPAHLHNDPLPMSEAYSFLVFISDSPHMIEAQLYTSMHSGTLLFAEAHVYHSHVVHTQVFETHISTISIPRIALRPCLFLYYFFFISISDSLLLVEAFYTSTHSETLLSVESHVYYPHAAHARVFEAHTSTILIPRIALRPCLSLFYLLFIPNSYFLFFFLLLLFYTRQRYITSRKSFTSNTHDRIPPTTTTHSTHTHSCTLNHKHFYIHMFHETPFSVK